MGQYSRLLKEVENILEYDGNQESLRVSLKVLDALDENTSALPVKHAIVILDDAKKLLLQMVGIN